MSEAAARGDASRFLDEGFVRLVTVAFVLLGAIFGLMEPEGSAELGAAGALFFWVLHGVAAVPCIVLASALLSRLHVARRLPPMGFVLASGVLAAVGFSLLALAIEWAFGIGEGGAALAGAGSQGFLWLWLDEFAGLAPPFLLAWVLVNLPRLMRLGSTGMPPAPEPEAPASAAAAGKSPRVGTAGNGPEAAATPPRTPAEDPGPSPAGEGLLARLPEALGTDVVLLTSDLHYLHVYTTRGRTMVLYNLADAEAELGDAGLRVHRSHWVAGRHVLGVRRKSSGMVCLLTGGLEAPVSRRRQKDVVARYGRDARYYPEPSGD
ncbi:MAG: LytTR family DNA-binding domain-containing protein [Gammaproteobacteria bacterium]